ncbi:MAG: AtpZ/AtpI family protein [Blastocatellales bacterium]
MGNSQQSKLTAAMAAGGMVSSNIAGGVILGYLLDRWLKTAPWLLITGVVLGLVGALIGVYKVSARSQQD